MTKEEEINEVENLKIKVEEMTDTMKENIYRQKKEEEDILKMLKILSLKIDSLTNEIIREKRYYFAKADIKENILTYVMGAFAGGLIMGLSIYKKVRD